MNGKLARSTTALNLIGKKFLLRVGATAMTLLSANDICCAGDFKSTLCTYLEKVMLPAVCTENLNPDVVVMQSAKDGMRFDASDRLNWARDRRILVQ